MKPTNLILTSILFLLVFFCQAQVKLEQKELTNLVAISELYSNNPNIRGEQFLRSIGSLRTPKLNNIVDALLAVGKSDTTILENQFLARPANDELVFWYVIREIHYNLTNKTQKSRPNIEIANEILSKNIDVRWLLDNYYYRIHGGIASLFNTANLSNYNFNLDSLGFENESEKAIFFLNIINSLIGGRFKVLQMMKNDQKIIDFSEKLPNFNGKKYYYYKNFDYEDFQWIGYDKTESYKERNIGSLYNTLIIQFGAIANLKGKKAAQEFFFNSILHEPKYFHLTKLKDDLQSIYDKSK